MPPSETERETYSRETDHYGKESDGQVSAASRQSIQLPNGAVGGFHHPKYDTGQPSEKYVAYSVIIFTELYI